MTIRLMVGNRLRLLDRADHRGRVAERVRFGRRQPVFEDMVTIDLGYVGGHRAVDEYRHARHPARRLQARDGVQDLLRAADGEARHHDHAAAREGFVEQRGEFVLGVRLRMQPVAVRRLDDQVVRMRGRQRRLHDRVVIAAEVAREGQHLVIPVHHDARRAENVPGRQQAERGPAAGFGAFVERDGLQQVQRALRIVQRVERLRRMMLRVAVAVREIGFFLLQPRAVAQHDVAEFGRGRRAVHRPAEPFARQHRQIAGMVDVRVREHDRVERVGCDRQRNQLRSRRFLVPWNRPQSTSTRRLPCSTRYFEPVTVSVAPRKVSFMDRLTEVDGAVSRLQRGCARSDDGNQGLPYPYPCSARLGRGSFFGRCGSGLTSVNAWAGRWHRRVSARVAPVAECGDHQQRGNARRKMPFMTGVAGGITGGRPGRDSEGRRTRGCSGSA